MIVFIEKVNKNCKYLFEKSFQRKHAFSIFVLLKEITKLNK